MIRQILISNINKCTTFEKEIIELVTNKPITWFNDENNSDDEISNVIINSFSQYMGHKRGDKPHPYYILYKVITLSTNIDKLISQTDLYGSNSLYAMYANKVNKVYTSEYKNRVLTILKAFAERDYDEIVERYQYGDNITLKVIVSNIEKYAEDIASNLDTTDLESICMFCREFNAMR